MVGIEASKEETSQKQNKWQIRLYLNWVFLRFCFDEKNTSSGNHHRKECSMENNPRRSSLQRVKHGNRQCFFKRYSTFNQFNLPKINWRLLTSFNVWIPTPLKLIVYLTSISLSYDIWFFGVSNFQLCHKAQQFFIYVSRGTEPFDEFHSSRSCNSTSIVNDLDRLWKCSNGSKGPNSAKKHKQKHCNQQSSELNCHMAFEAIRLSLPLCI